MDVLNIRSVSLNIVETRKQLISLLGENIKALGAGANTHDINMTLHPREDDLLAEVADTCKMLIPGITIGNHNGKSKISVFLLSPDVTIWSDAEKESNIEAYLKASQDLHRKVFLIFAGENQEMLCYHAVMAINDMLGRSQCVYKSTIKCYCDIQACYKLKYHIAHAKLEAAIGSRDSELREIEYWCRLALTGPAHLCLMDSISMSMKASILDRIRSHIYTVSGPSFFSDSCVLLFSPHPDDDVIAAGLGLQHMNRPGIDLHVAYCVTGHGSVRDIYLDCTPRNPTEACEKKADVRKHEALSALRVLGIAPEKVHFLKLPFYGDACHSRRGYDSSDVQIIKEIIRKINPDHIFLAGDLSDPHRTHEVCYRVIKEALEALYSDTYEELRKSSVLFKALGKNKAVNESEELCVEDIQSAVHGPINLIQCRRIQPLHVVLSIKQAVHVTFGVKLPILWLYRGSWNEFGLGEASLIISGDDAAVQRKQAAIQAHCSQMEASMFMGSDARSFDVRALERNAEIAEKLLSLKISDDPSISGAECYLCSLVLL